MQFRASLRLSLPLAALAIAACGEAVPRYQTRTAPDWVALLSDPDARVRKSALAAIEVFGAKSPDAILRALEARISLPLSPPTASPLAVAVDAEEAHRMGLSPLSIPEATGGALEVIRGRAVAAQWTPASFKAADDVIDIVLSRPRPRAEIERIQALLCVRGALAIRALAIDPAARQPSTSHAADYDGATPYASYLSSEVARFTAARAEKRAYAPENPRWKPVPRAKSAETAADFVVVAEPASDADALDERMAQSVRATGSPNALKAILITVRPERREALKRFAETFRGLTMAIVLDGVLFATATVPQSTGEMLELSLWPADGKKPALSPEDLAVVLAAGRLPWPMKPIPIDASYGADPSPDNLLSEAFVLLEEKAIPTLERLEAHAPLSWSRASAHWALQQIRNRVGVPEK